MSASAPIRPAVHGGAERVRGVGDDDPAVLARRAAPERSYSHGRPAKSTGRIARVRAVATRFTASTAMFRVEPSMSANTGWAP